MSNPEQRELRISLRRRLRLAAVALLGLVLPSAGCAPPAMCYVPPAPTDTPTPFMLCYVVAEPTETPGPDPFTSPLSPLPTPTPTPDAETRDQLRRRLMAENRFPQDVTRELGG